MVAGKQKDNRATKDIAACQKEIPGFLKFLCDIISVMSAPSFLTIHQQYIRTFLLFYLKLWLSPSLFPETQKKHVKKTHFIKSF